MSRTLPEESIRAIIEGRHGDPFSLLGPHDGTVTVWLPGVEALDLIDADGRAVAMDALAPGMFHVKHSGPYRLRAPWGEIDDPYRFGPGPDPAVRLGPLWHRMGARVTEWDGVPGTEFVVWAPNARRVSVVGHMNAWDARRHPMNRHPSGIWSIFLPGVAEGEAYKYDILGPGGEHLPQKADPVGFGAERLPGQASVVRDLRGATWDDAAWMESRAARHDIHAPISIYEVHLGSWRRTLDGQQLTYRDMAEQLVDYAVDMGFTHIELMPVNEYPFDGSWGYQPVGLFAPTARFGTPEDFRALIDRAHRKGLGVILDWVPGHFPTDDHGLGRFDGTALYEYGDPREGFHQDWNTLIPNLARWEVADHFAANGRFWLEEYHVDGLRVDAVASMLYRDYSRQPGEWMPNVHGGNENLEAIAFFRRVNADLYGAVPGIMTIAEESTAFPMVSRPVSWGGLGFGFKWNMGWMNDTLSFIGEDPLWRGSHWNKVTFGLAYAFNENFILPISHDEVVHGKGSMLAKMPGDDGQKFAGLRSYYGFMWTHPGKKLLFQGCEFGQWREWTHDHSLDWHLLKGDPRHRGLQDWVRALNRLYCRHPALHRHDCEAQGFGWIEGGAMRDGVLAYARYGDAGEAPVVAVINFAGQGHHGWRVGLPDGRWRVALNSNDTAFGGDGWGAVGEVQRTAEPWQGQAQSTTLDLPPLSAVILERVDGD